ncbi:MAG: hypothetical protein EP344_16470 [Bacteroidetes bacterium]|nr:MAG: hypothetical protein EP344_16470 [Bacteroidota bacterium]
MTRTDSFHLRSLTYLIRGLLFFGGLGPALQCIAQAPADTFRLVRTIPVTARYAANDNLDNLYLISPQNSVEKYSPDGTLLARYSNNRLGMATWLDVTNPMKILIWYPDFRTVVFLNRSLTELGTLNLIEAGLPEVQSLAAAVDGNVWLYDEVAFKLIKITPDGERRFESQALNQLRPERISFRTIRDNGSEVLASDPETGLFWFDTYGQYVRTLPEKGIYNFVLEQDQWTHLTQDTLHQQQLRAFAGKTIPIPAKCRPSDTTVWLTPGRLLIQQPQALEIWTWR